ncbi:MULTISPECIES: type IV pilus modification PilV family protein [Shewanella]|uniref:MSHA pilin protein MshD n=1 Tax=Shewanella baltica (strain OS155 / ATCC BAA-1091) TaxID=325240 RepID=A3D984_SHEB5|nr:MULTISPECIES: type II secretion system protein [Shewanella]ABN63297.1 MSHA pilin protein MshD [Shewanella baltica OS155]AEH15645.1 MSHA pilin protein MshD [Shewanella baltica OS117]MDT3295294.1 type II secretion system protein [Shewanella sp. SP2S2-6]
MPTNALFKGHIQARQLGFTLIELVIGMLVIGIAIVMLTSMLFPQADRAASTLHRVRSAELAHSVMNEIWGKRYDQNTNANGGTPACDSPLGSNCSTSLGPEVGESRNSFNDVDDYNGLNETATMLNSTQTYAAAYPNYQLSVTVAYGPAPNTKLVTINVTTPDNEVITYNLVRSNY